MVYLPPEGIVLVADLKDVSFLEAQPEGLAGDLLVQPTIVVEVGTDIFLCGGTVRLHSMSYSF